MKQAEHPPWLRDQTPSLLAPNLVPHLEVIDLYRNFPMTFQFPNREMLRRGLDTNPYHYSIFLIIQKMGGRSNLLLLEQTRRNLHPQEDLEQMKVTTKIA
jgi:hypothetical protein